MQTALVRFVGGEWHNRHIHVEIRHCIHVAATVKPLALANWDKPVSCDDLHFRRETYHLCRFVSEAGAKFIQYVHESKIRNGVPDQWAYKDKPLPALPDAYHHMFTAGLVAAVLKR